MIIEKKFSYIKYYEVEHNGVNYGLSFYFDRYGRGTRAIIENLDIPYLMLHDKDISEIMDEIPGAYRIFDFEINKKQYLKKAGYSEI